MTEQLRDIRELMDDTDAYRDELKRRWTGLLSYRYIGRNHSTIIRPSASSSPSLSHLNSGATAATPAHARGG